MVLRFLSQANAGNAAGVLWPTRASAVRRPLLPCASNTGCVPAQQVQASAEAFIGRSSAARGHPSTAPLSSGPPRDDWTIAADQLPSASGRGSDSYLHPTLRLIKARQQASSKPGARRDGFKLGLVVEGGGMRGVISGAMLMALQELNLVNVFDAVYGASAGAINATYFLSGQKHGLHIYLDELTRGSSFLNYSNLLRGGSKPFMNLDYLIEHVMHNVKPLNWEKVLEHPVQLNIVASCLDTLQPVTLSNFSSQRDLVECLKATAMVPKFAGQPRHVRGRKLVDAAVFEPVPVASAIKDGCTHVLVLCTRPPHKETNPLAGLVKQTLVSMAKNTLLNPPYMREAWRAEANASGPCPEQQLYAALHGCPYEVQSSMGSFVLPIYPASTAGCHPLTLDRAVLSAALDVGHAAACAVVGPVVGRTLPLPSAAAAAGPGGAFGAAELYSLEMDATLQFRP